MPPRYAYWTILVDGQPTAFRAGMQEDLMPTFKRLKAKHASAEMKWFQNGKLWTSRLEAQEAMRARGERGREGDVRQRASGFRERQRFSRPQEPKSSRPQLDWKPKGEFTPAPKRTERPSKPEWKPKGSFDREPRPEWKSRSARPEWKPKSSAPASKPAEKRKWIPKEEYKKSKGIEAPRDSKWRPGGAHRDPRQKYKDAKKAKWSKFKKNIRQKWESKTKKKP